MQFFRNYIIHLKKQALIFCDFQNFNILKLLIESLNNI